MILLRHPLAHRLSRRRGYRLPSGVINVARPGRFGNPFIVGKHGDRARCVQLCETLLAGWLAIGVDEECVRAQRRFLAAVKADLPRIKSAAGFACWCALDGQPCHRDLFIRLARFDFER